jgi:hypothetical protein
MGKHTRNDGRLHEGRPGALGALIHEAVRRVIEVAVEEELTDRRARRRPLRPRR